MTTPEMGDLLNQIGQFVADRLGKIPDDVFVYIDAGDQNYGGAIFENLEDNVIYHDFEPMGVDLGFGDIVLRLWDIAPPDKKWSVLLYDIKDGKFDAEFLYTDDMDKDRFEHDYREDALIARYGDKPVIYPPMEEGDYHELTEDELANLDRVTITDEPGYVPEKI
jgi:hypothetical protein